MAMILGWRDQASYDESLIALNVGGTNYSSSRQTGLDPNDRYILEQNGFTLEAPQCYTPGAIQLLLESSGPLWVASWAPGPHIRVVTGMVGNQVSINDPAPVNVGSRYTRTFESFFGQMETLGSRELQEPSPVYVTYLA
jgi:hypothetical protein